MNKFVRVLATCLIFVCGISGATQVGVGVWPKKRITSFAWDVTEAALAHYKLNDNAASSVVTDATGNLNGVARDNLGEIDTSTITTAGKINEAFVFNGTTQYVQIADTALLDDPAAITVSCWVKTAVNANDRLVASRDAGAPNNGYALFVENATGKAAFLLDTSAGTTTPTGAAIDDNNWHHVVATWDGATAIVYVDTVAGTPAAIGGTITKAITTRFGTGTQATGEYFTGSLDNVMIIGRAISANEVKGLYNNGNGTEDLSGQFL